MFRVAAGAGLTVTLGLMTLAALAGPAAAAPVSGSGSGSGLPTTNSQCNPSPQDSYPAQTGTPWAQQALDLSAAQQYSTGAGVKVAVIDSGVDANSQFGNRVQVGKTFASAPAGPANGDCVGHGTMVAGIIGAAPSASTQFRGVAPGATIESIKVTNSDGANISTTTLAQAIGVAITSGARVINVSIDTMGNDPVLHGVITYALQHNIVVVAAAGNDTPAQPAQGNQPAQPAQKGPFYPASYPGVLSVGAMDKTGQLASFSDRKSNAAVIAPGADVTSTFPGPSGDHYLAEDGTSFAAPFVSGLAALLISRDPGLTSAQVVQRIEDTADGSIGAGSGNGLINPVQALTDQASTQSAQGAARPGAVKIDRSPPDLGEKVVALSLGGGALVIAIIVIAAAVVIPAGRRRGWRPGES